MSQIEITFLGTTAGIPTRQRNHASVYITHRGETESSYLFDCGEGTQRQIFMTNLNFMRINHIFISHWHADHFAGLLGILETMSLEGRKKPLNIYGPEAQKFVPALTNLGYSTKDFPIIAKNVYHQGTKVQTILKENNFEIQAIPMKHGIPAVAYALVENDRIRINKSKAKKAGLPEKGPIFKELKDKGIATYENKKYKLKDVSDILPGKKVVYSGDTMINTNMKKFSKDADLLIHDSTFFTELKEGYRHATADDVIKLAKSAKVKQLILTHISRRYQNLTELKDKIKKHKNVIIAKDFMKVIVK